MSVCLCAWMLACVSECVCVSVHLREWAGEFACVCVRVCVGVLVGAGA